MLERVVQIIPMPLKLALGALVVLLLTALLGAGQAHRRLAAAERRAATDALTGLPNRRHADEVLERLLAASRRNRRPLAVILFDLDHFKAINDSFGHGCGDVALQATATASRELLRGSDYVARFGGEEFLLLLPETGLPDALLVAEKLRLKLSLLEIDGLEGDHVTASFGVAIYSEHGVGAEELLAAADAALYRAKDLGRDRVECADALPVEAESEFAAA